jgi:nitrous oxide reductase
MDGDTQPSRRFDRRLLLIAVAFVLAATAIWASSSLAGGSGPASPAKAKVSQVNKGPASPGLHTGGAGGSRRDCPFKHRLDTSADV